MGRKPNTDEQVAQAGEAQRDRQRRYAKDRAKASADIGAIPKCKNPARRKRCERNLHLFLRTYFPGTTGLNPFCKEQKDAIKRIERCILHGGRFINGFPRGFAKTTISQNSVIFAAIYGHRRFPVLFSSDEPAALTNLESIKKELATNDLLLDDFPEVCYPIFMLDDTAAACRSQHSLGEKTLMQWRMGDIVLPTVKGSKASGCKILCKGLTSAARGMVHKRPNDGKQQRPDFIILDDPQTDESARSPTQIETRMHIIKRSLLRLGGHQESMACVMNATVIEEHDLVDQLLDPDENAAWGGVRVKFLKSPPDRHEDLWMQEYASIRRTYNNEIEGDQARAHKEATAFYRKNRKEMERGAVVTWKYAYNSDEEISALQRYYNILIDDGEEVVQAELQNDPKKQVDSQDYATAVDILEKVSDVPQGVIPVPAHRLTAMIDVQGQALFYSVVAWTEQFSGYVIDYGTFPEQPRRYFSLAGLPRPMETLVRGAGTEGRVLAGLRALSKMLLDRYWKRQDGGESQIERCLIDAQWGETTDLIYEFCRTSPFRSILMPSHGRYYGASSIPISDKRHKLKQGERVGWNWFIPAIQNRGDVPHVVYDTNAWKSWLHKRWLTPEGDPGSLTLYSATKSHHRLLADHCTAEYPVRTFGRGREVDEWKQRPSKPDNHWFDTLIGSGVAASISGLSLVGEKAAGGSRGRKRVSVRKRA